MGRGQWRVSKVNRESIESTESQWRVNGESTESQWRVNRESIESQ
jgi:hypothetical protein